MNITQHWLSIYAHSWTRSGKRLSLMHIGHTPHLLFPLSLLLGSPHPVFLFFIFSFIYISWRLITLQYCSGFCHTLIWISHGFTCVPHPEPPSHVLPHPIPLVDPSEPALSTCLIHQTWTGDLFHNWKYTCFNAVFLYCRSLYVPGHPRRTSMGIGDAIQLQKYFI